MRYDPAGINGDQLRDTFNPLLRNLLEAELVVSVDDPAGNTWQLVEQAQRRRPQQLGPLKPPGKWGR